MEEVIFYKPKKRLIPWEEIKEKARLQGVKNLPDTKDTKFDSGQDQILAAFKDESNNVNNRAKGILIDKKAKCVSLQNNVKEIEANLSNNKIKNKLLNDITTFISTRTNQAVSLYKEKLKRQGELNYFRNVHELTHREPDYPEDIVYHFAVVFVLLMGESLGNMFFFAKGSNIGMLGGLLEAIMISIVNVGLSIFIGIFGIRYLHHKKKLKLLGVTLSIIFLIVSPIFNLATAHYRDLLGDPVKAAEILETSIEQEDITPSDAKQLALKAALPYLKAAPFELTFDGGMLLLVGMISAFISCYKGYKSDDPYPGYGEVHRRYKKAEKVFEKEETEKNNIYENCKKEIEMGVESANADYKAITVCLDEISNITDKWGQSINDINKDCNDLLKQYREINMQIRTNPPPSYFSIFEDNFAKEALPQNFEDWLNNFQKDVKKSKENIDTDSPQKIKELDEVFNIDITDGFNKFKTSTSETAKKEIKEEENTFNKEV